MCAGHAVRDLALTLIYLYSSHIWHRKNVLRGALTNGYAWIFIVLSLPQDGSAGASYKFSHPVHVDISRPMPGPAEYMGPGANMVAGILSYWVSLCFRGFNVRSDNG